MLSRHPVKCSHSSRRRPTARIHTQSIRLRRGHRAGSAEPALKFKRQMASLNILRPRMTPRLQKNLHGFAGSCGKLVEVEVASGFNWFNHVQPTRTVTIAVTVSPSNQPTDTAPPGSTARHHEVAGKAVSEPLRFSNQWQHLATSSHWWVQHGSTWSKKNTGQQASHHEVTKEVTNVLS